MAWTIQYYSEKLQLAVLALPDDILADYLRLTELLTEFGADLRLPHSRALGKGLFELRPKGREGIARVFYCAQPGRRIFMLHCFIKKSQETPKRDLDLARKRLKEIANAYS